MMFGLVTIVHTAKNKKQLDRDTETLQSIARKHLCQLAVLKFQQMDGLNTALPYGLRKINALRTLTTESAAVLMPFRAHEIMDVGGTYCGMNAISHNLIIANRKNLINGNGFILGVSGSGKTTLVLESLVAGLKASLAGTTLPGHVLSVDAPGIARVDLVDATPIGVNVRSTVGTYSGVLDDLRRAFAALPNAKEQGLKAGAFSYNTGSLRCPTCDGTGQISLDVQFLPDVDIPCPDCRGSRYGREAYAIQMAIEGDVELSTDAEMERNAAHESASHESPATAYSHAGDFESVHTLSLPEVLTLTVDQALSALAHLKKVWDKLQILHDLGLGYLTLGEATPALSGGEAQRLKLASEMRRSQDDTLFIFDEPTIGLHPLDVETLIGVLQKLIEHGATVVVIEHDLDMIANADYVIDMGPGGGETGGRIVAEGTPAQVAANSDSLTGRYLARELE